MKLKLNRSIWLISALVLVLLLGVNLLVGSWRLRIDATEDQLYTLSDGTQTIVEDLKKPLTLTFYFSKSAPGVPLPYKTFGKRVVELLHEYRRLHPEMLKVKIINPVPDSDEEVQAEKLGLQGAQLKRGNKFFLGLVGISGKKEQVIPALDPRRERYLEYDISEMIVRLQQGQPKHIGVISSLPVLGQKATIQQRIQGVQPAPAWAAFQELQKIYQVQSLAESQPWPDDLDLLIVLHPKHLSEITLFQIDQYVLAGGSLVLLLDPYSRVDPATQMMSRMGQMGRKSAPGSDLAPLLAHWGIQYDPSKILGDLKRAVQVNTANGPSPFALWQHLDQTAVNPDLVATKNLENLILIEPGAFTLDKSSPLHLTPLLQSSTQAGLVPIDLLNYSSPDQINQAVKPTGEKWTIAGILTGKLTSAYPTQPKNLPADFKKAPLLKVSQKETHLLLIADVDFLQDRFSIDSFSLLGQVMHQPKNDNLGFFVNMIDFLGGSTQLMGIRSRGKFTRPFERFATLEAKASVTYRAEQAKLQAKLQQIQRELTKLNQQKKGTQTALSKEQLAQVQEFRDNQRQTKIALRKIRKLLHQDIETEKTWITLLNLLTVPLLVCAIGYITYRRRFRTLA